MKHFIKLFSFIILIVSCNSNSEKKIIKEKSISNNKPTVIKVFDKEIIFDNNNDSKIFLQLVSNNITGIDFKNTSEADIYKNHETYPQFYNGGGVAVGDINNDGLPDIYFAGNSSKDKLYINQGNFKFKDITDSSGIGKDNYGWSFGVNMVDVNADGFLDIYVCKAGAYKEKNFIRNRLFINNGDGTFKEDAMAYGLGIDSYSVQSTFFDYDMDGDLDMYLANHPDFGTKKLKIKNFKAYVEKINNGTLLTDHFYENVNGKFIDKTKEAKLFNFGYKNSVGVGDLNNDGYPDLYVCTDYAEPDYYFINNGDKTFTNMTKESFKHITFNSMGNDIADINNDGKLDIFVSDMTPSDHVKSKMFMASMDTKKFNKYVNNGFHHQYMINTLQLNNGDNTFSDVGQLLKIDKTDWSWAPLFFDIDLDGNKDLFVTNGIKENINENDLKSKIEKQKKKVRHQLSLSEFLEVMHTETTPNLVFKNEGNLKFKETSANWMDKKDFNSNGAAYADLDGDGDLDLVLNNMDEIASIYKNTGNSGNSIAIQIKGTKNNTFGLGTKISIPLENKTLFHEHFPAKGYLSSVDYKIIIGLGTLTEVPKMIIEWPNGKVSEIYNIKANQEILLDYSNLKKIEKNSIKPNTWLQKKAAKDLGITFKHKEDKINDFKHQILLPYSQSQNGPFIDTADVNNDGEMDFFIGGASGSPGELYLQTKDGNFTKDQNDIWNKDKKYEDQGVLFFDYDGDGDKDLYVTSGGAAFANQSTFYQDRIYANDGSGKFTKINVLPKNTTSNQVVIANDVDGDGDLDLFVGGRVIPDKYPYSPTSQLLINENGTFIDKTAEQALSLKKAGLVTDAVFSDYDSDGDKDLIITAEWSAIQIYNNNKGHFIKVELPILKNTEGIWFSVKAIDLDKDGDEDYLFGNLGLNSKFSAKPDKPFHVYCDDFDANGTYDIVLSKEYKGNLVPMRGRQCSSEQMPFISEKFKSFTSFAEAKLSEIIGASKLDKALHFVAKDFHSICLLNNGDGSFEKINLPTEAQVSPIMDFTITDLNNDSISEIIAIGNLYSTEVETPRYDASIGTVLQYNNKEFKVIPASTTGLRLHGNSKDATLIKTNDNKQIYIVSNNNQSIDVHIIKK